MRIGILLHEITHFKTILNLGDANADTCGNPMGSDLAIKHSPDEGDGKCVMEMDKYDPTALCAGTRGGRLARSKPSTQSNWISEHRGKQRATRSRPASEWRRRRCVGRSGGSEKRSPRLRPSRG